jgi:hypothetical protein
VEILDAMNSDRGLFGNFNSAGEGDVGTGNFLLYLGYFGEGISDGGKRGGEGGMNFWCSEKVGYSLPGKLPSVTIESFNR